MAITTAHSESRVIQAMHDMCNIPWDACTFIADHMTCDWFTAPIANSTRVVKFRRIAGTRGYEMLTPADVTATVDMATGLMVMPATVRTEVFA